MTREAKLTYALCSAVAVVAVTFTASALYERSQQAEIENLRALLNVAEQQCPGCAYRDPLDTEMCIEGPDNIGCIWQMQCTHVPGGNIYSCSGAAPPVDDRPLDVEVRPTTGGAHSIDVGVR